MEYFPPFQKVSSSATTSTPSLRDERQHPGKATLLMVMSDRRVRKVLDTAYKLATRDF